MVEESFRNPIQIPDLEARVAFVQSKGEQKKVTLPKDVALYLAQNFRANACALEGALALVIAHSSVIGADITLNYAKTILKNFIVPQARTATVDPFQKLPLRQGTAKEASRTRQAPIAAKHSSLFWLETVKHSSLFWLETVEVRKIGRVREVLEVNMREREREHLAGRDAYERALERRAKKHKRA